MDVQETVRQQFDPVAAEYAISAIHASGPDLSAMVGAIGLRGDEHVLDDVRAALAIQADYSLTVEVALMIGRKQA